MMSLAGIRPMRAADIAQLTGVLARAYQSDQNFELRLNSYLQMRSVATFVAEWGGKPVGMVVGNDYGPSAYVSQMAVDPPLQRRGIGSALMRSLIAWTREHGFAAVELDATPAGAPLYEQYGFAACGATLVYATASGGGYPGAARRYAPGDRAAVFAADARAFGADRSDVLRLLLDAPRNNVFVSGRPGNVTGYAVAQPGPGLLGPVVVPESLAAAQLIDAARASLGPPHRVNIPSENPAMVAIVGARGYVYARSLAHMIRGRPPVRDGGALFARINLGQG
jgi:ribosomal-protein-alanine N-acetyltransferase